MSEVEARAEALLSPYRAIVWEADAASMECTYLSESGSMTFGYSRDDWTPKILTETIHEEDRDDTVANFALCTGRGRGHNFSHRSVASDGRVLRFFNIVRVVRGGRGVAIRIRGISLDVTNDPDLFDESSALHAIPSQASTARASNGDQ